MDTIHSETIQNRIKGPAGYLYIDDGGSGDIPVVFVHSYSGNTENWRSQLEHLRKEQRAITFDLRGHGKSEAPTNNDYQVESLAKDIEAVVDNLKLEQFVLVGHSMGGSASIAYAGSHPNRVIGLIVVGTPGKTPEEQAKPIIESLESEAYDKVMEDYMKKLLTNAKPEVDKAIRNELRKITREASLSIIKSAFRFDPSPAFTSFQGPKLIVFTPLEKQPNALPTQFPDTPHQMIDGTSHWIQMDKPDEFNTILDKFLETLMRDPINN